MGGEDGRAGVRVDPTERGFHTPAPPWDIWGRESTKKQSWTILGTSRLAASSLEALAVPAFEVPLPIPIDGVPFSFGDERIFGIHILLPGYFAPRCNPRLETGVFGGLSGIAPKIITKGEVTFDVP